MVYFKKKASIEPIDPEKINLLSMVDEISNNLNISSEVVLQAIKYIIASETKEWYKADNAEVDIDYKRATIKLIHGDNVKYVDVKSFPVSLFVKIRSRFKEQVHLLKNQNAINRLMWFKDKIVPVKVVSIALRSVLVDIAKTSVMISCSSFSKSDVIEVNKIYHFLLNDVRLENNKIKLVITRNGNQFLSSLLPLYIPEINNNTILIERIFRVNGVRAIVAINSTWPKPIACCIGHGGSRITSIQRELNGEKMIWVHYSYNMVRCIVSCFRLKRYLGQYIIQKVDHYVYLYLQERALYTRILGNRIIIEIIKSTYQVELVVILYHETSIDNLISLLLSSSARDMSVSKLGKNNHKKRATLPDKNDNDFITQLFSIKPSYMLINMLLSKNDINSLVSILLLSIDGNERTEHEIEKFITEDASVSEYCNKHNVN